jgi:glycosyltransferase involved in cell wall biosynthesis
MISIITPCLNLQKDDRVELFAKMMNSVHNQTYTEIEHIVVDGFSTDKTLSILHQYQEYGWIHNLLSEPDNGIYQALNRGVTCASGEYILIMNTDDYFSDLRYFETAVKILDANNLDYIHADKLILEKNGQIRLRKCGNVRAAFFRMPFRHQTLLVRHDVFSTIPPFEESYRIAADYKFVLSMLQAAYRGFHLPKIVLHSRAGGVSANRQQCIEEVRRVLYESYGQRYNLTHKDCEEIYTQTITPQLMQKIRTCITEPQILDSLELCYQLSTERTMRTHSF